MQRLGIDRHFEDGNCRLPGMRLSDSGQSPTVRPVAATSAARIHSSEIVTDELGRLLGVPGDAVIDLFL